MIFTAVIFCKRYILYDFDDITVMNLDSISVEEVMSKGPLIVPGDMSIKEGAELLKRRGVSTLIIAEGENPVGIVTDRDFVVKVVAGNIDIENAKLRDIMTSPVVMIPHDTVVSDAAKVMSRRRIRKLPVLKDGKIVGILSENDVVRISPDLIAIVREYAEMHRDTHNSLSKKEYVAGKCEMCGQYSLRLSYHEGMLICPECYDAIR